MQKWQTQQSGLLLATRTSMYRLARGWSVDHNGCELLLLLVLVLVLPLAYHVLHGFCYRRARRVRKAKLR